MTQQEDSRHWLPSPIVGMRAAFVFMTRIPVGGFPYRSDDWRWAPAHFPLVGAIIGAASGAVFWAAFPLGSLVAATLCVLTSIYLTGAFHEDGLADSADALGGSHSHKKLHDILKDSRIGTYGASALVISILLRVLLLAELSALGALGCAGLIAVVHVLARVGPVMLMAALPYVAGENAKGSSVAAGGAASRATVASLWGLLALAAASLLGLRPLVLVGLVLCLLAITARAARVFSKAAGGYTGDFLGATEQLLELSLYVTLLGLWRYLGDLTWLV